MNKLTRILTIAAFAAIATPALAQVRLNISIGPPPPRQEIIIASPYEGAVWVPGYSVYEPSVTNYVWVPGAWQRPPSPGVTWVRPRYVRVGDHYNYYAGRWGNPGKHKGWAKQQKNFEGGHIEGMEGGNGKHGKGHGNGHGNGNGHGKGHGH